MSDTAQPCSKHPDQVADKNCSICGKAICEECIRVFGPYCSTACLETDRNAKAPKERQIDPAIAEMHRHTEIVGKVGKIAKLVAAVTVLLIAAFFAYRMWLRPYGKTAWQYACPGSPGTNCILVADNSRIVARIGRCLLALNPADGSEIWKMDTGRDQWASVTLQGDEIVLSCGEAIRKVSLDGKKTADISFEKCHRLLGFNDTAAILMENEEVAEKKHLKDLQEAGFLPKVFERNRDPFRYLNGDEKRLRPVRLCGRSLAGELLWQIPMRLDITVTDNVLVGDTWIGCVGSHVKIKKLKKTSAKQPAGLGFFPRSTYRLVAIDVTDGNMRFRTSIGETPVLQLKIEDDELHCQNYTHKFSYDMDGELTGTTKISYDRGTNLQALRDKIERTGLVVDGRGATFYDEKGREQWNYTFPGGVVSHSVTDECVYMIGHRTEEGGKVADVAETAQRIGFEGAGAAYMASGASVEDHSFVALNTDNGRMLWERKRLVGQIISQDSCVVLLQDTAQTSVIVRAAKGRGELYLHQLNPRNGKAVFTRKDKEMALRDARVLGKHLVALAYDRELRKGDESGRRGNCTGLVAIRLK